MSILHRAQFTISAAQLDQLPPPGPPEVCFVGRSNAGKSSAINILANQKRLAFSSKTPGRTRLINMFGIPDPLDPDQALGYLVDLPGYGYAAVNRQQKQEWDQVLGSYLRTRSALAGVVLMVDIRRGLTPLDEQLAKWIAPTGKPLLVLLTKADKFAYGKRIQAALAAKKSLAAISPAHAIAFSATHRIGIEEATHFIENWISPQVVP